MFEVVVGLRFVVKDYVYPEDNLLYIYIYIESIYIDTKIYIIYIYIYIDIC